MVQNDAFKVLHLNASPCWDVTSGWLLGGYSTFHVYLCLFVLAWTWQKTVAWLSSALLWCPLMAPKCAQTISCSAQTSLLMLFFVCVHLTEIMCVCVCFLGFLCSGMAICSFPLFQTLQAHIKIDIHLQCYLDTEIYFSPDVSRLTHDWLTSLWKTRGCDWLNRRRTFTR